MAEQDVEDSTLYRAVMNHEEQYSIWPEGRKLPAGWRDAGKSGTKAECLKFIEEVWTDMRPLSLRRRMEQIAGSTVRPPALSSEPVRDSQDDLVAWLCEGDHPVCATAGSVDQFLERIRSGYVNLRFTDTRGGTELGIQLDTGASDTSRADLAQRKGTVHLAGDLSLNYRPVRLTADVALETLEGVGRLQVKK